MHGQWEYRLQWINLIQDSVLVILNDSGEQGWELCGMWQQGGMPAMIFKRRRLVDGDKPLPQEEKP